LADEWKPRAQRREEARELAKLLMEQGRKPKPFRWDITLSCFVALMGILLIIFPPESRLAMSLWLAAMFILGLYPAFHFAEWLPLKNKQVVKAIAALGLAAVICALGYAKWPSIRRHVLGKAERLSFEDAIKPQQGADLEVHIGCPVGDEKTCIFAEQFIGLFGESDWKIQPIVERLTLSKAMDGVMVYRKGGSKEDMMKRWNSGGYFNLNEQHLLAVQNAFQAIHIEINGGTNPELNENVMMIYFGPERENEAEPTDLTRSTEWATGKRDGPFPGKRRTLLCRWLNLSCG
jgi:hypothetical protein